MNKKQIEVRKNISKLRSAISELIVEHCEKYPETTYTEINTVLIDEMKSILGYELKELWSDEEK